MKRPIPILPILIVIALAACAVSKESRRIRKGSGVIQNSAIQLRASWEGAVGFLTFSLRDNHFFDINEGAMFGWDYYAGTWTINQDTIRLDYIDGHKPHDFLPIAIISTEKEYLTLPRQDSGPPLSLSITFCELENM